jgi:two-component system, OmpR family, response regulator
MKKHLLLLEDDVVLSETVCEFLTLKGYQVSPFYDGVSAQIALFEHHFDLLLLDVNVPAHSGFALLKEARENGTTTPAIFLTSLNGVDDLEKGYESGCDDYLRKPFALKELLLRIESLLKREFFHAKADYIVLGQHLFFDISSHSLILHNEKVQLHAKEAKLLKLFLQKPNQIITHETLQSHLWEYDEEPSDDALRTYIKNIRKLIGKDRIVSLKKLGYQFTLE